MAGFRKHRRPTSVTAHVCHRLELPAPSRRKRAAEALAPEPVPSEAKAFWTVKRRLPEPQIHDPAAVQTPPIVKAPPIEADSNGIPKPARRAIPREVHLDQAIATVREAGAWPQELSPDYRKKVDLLERRLAKVSGLLESNELEIRRLRQMKATNSGLASEYREVQGIAADDDQAEAKKEMMSAIFGANLKLHERIRAQESPTAESA